MRGLRHTLIHIALAALILRAFLPTGWMPNPQGPTESAFVICTMDGPVQTTDGKALPGKDDPRAHEACPFAAAPHLATPLVATAMPLPDAGGRYRAPCQSRHGPRRSFPLRAAIAPRPARTRLKNADRECAA